MTKLTITPLRKHVPYIAVFFALSFAIIFGFSWRSAYAQQVNPSASEHIITLHDDGVEKGFITRHHTLREAFIDAGIRVDAQDITEPGIDETLVAPSYEVNIYRARPVVIRDESAETKVVTAYRTARQIATQANITLNDEDIAQLAPSKDMLTDGAAEVLTITRATGFMFEFYGAKEQHYTMADTVGAMLAEKGITLGENDDITPSRQTPLTDGMNVRLWRNGVQTITIDEDVPFEISAIKDANRTRDYKEVKSPGELGRRTVTYEINMQNGVEISRKEINSTVTKKPVTQVEVVGARGCANNAVANRELGHRLMLEYGFGEDQWQYLDKLWTHESGWIECKANYAGSGAYGIPQALPGSKMGLGWQDDPEVQIRWGLGYIKGQYGDPLGAYNRWRSNNGY